MKKLALLALTITASAAILVLTGCKINGKSFGPGGGSSNVDSNGAAESSDGEAPASGSRACGGEPLERARRNGLKGPCWDPPGSYDTVPPVHIVDGMRAMEPASSGDDVYWFEMPKEAIQSGTCALLPTGEAYVAETIYYEPYADEDGMPKPAISDMLGEPLAKVLSYLEGLDTPLCVLVTWDEACQREPGTLCDDERAPNENGGLHLTFAGKHPR